MAESRGIAIQRQNDTAVLILAALFDSGNAKITAGTTTLRLWHVVPGSLAIETWDFTNNTFTSGAPLGPTATMAVVAAENGSYATGLWLYRFTQLGQLVPGDKYIAEITHASLPRPIILQFQYGGVEGDSLEPTVPGRTLDVSVTGSVGGVGRAVNLSVAIQGNAMRIDCALEEEGVTKTAVTAASAQLFDQDGNLKLTVSNAQFGPANVRGVFSFVWLPHSLVPGTNYQLVVNIDGVSTTKLFKNLAV